MNRFNGSAVYESAFTQLGRYEAPLRNTERLASLPSPLSRGRRRRQRRLDLAHWKVQARAQKADEYPQHAKRTVFPKLRNIEGYGEAYLLRHPINGSVERIVLILWDSMQAVRRFAGDDADQTVGEQEARSVLSGFDDFVTDLKSFIELKKGMKK